MTTRVVPFHERHRFVAPESAVPAEPSDPAEALVQPDGRPARRSKKDRCPQCGAKADRRVRSGMGARVSVTCEACGFEFPQELAASE